MSVTPVCGQNLGLASKQQNKVQVKDVTPLTTYDNNFI